MGKTLIRAGQLKPFSESELIELLQETAYNLEVLKTVASKGELDFVRGVTSSIQSQLDDKLDDDVLKKDGEVVWTDDATVATALAVSKKISSEVASAQIGGAMAFKGNWSEKSLPIKAGYSYAYDSGTVPTGTTLEPGDMLIANSNINTSAAINEAGNWSIVQTNISGAVTSSSSLALGKLIVGGGGSVVMPTSASDNGVIKLDHGFVKQATQDDVRALVGTLFGIKDFHGDVKLNVTPGDAIKIVGTGSTTVDFDEANRLIKFRTPPMISVSGGQVYGGKYISGVSLNGSTLKFSHADLPSDVRLVYKSNQALTGNKDGTNRVFYLPEPVIPSSVGLYLNGQQLHVGVDYTISGAGSKTVTFATDANIPISTDLLTASYVKA